MIPKSMKILVVAAHPDDEVLGCGGTIARHSDAGDKVHVLIVGEGATSRQKIRDREQFKKELCSLAQSANRVAEILGCNSLDFSYLIIVLIHWTVSISSK